MALDLAICSAFHLANRSFSNFSICAAVAASRDPTVANFAFRSFTSDCNRTTAPIKKAQTAEAAQFWLKNLIMFIEGREQWCEMNLTAARTIRCPLPRKAPRLVSL